MLRPSDEALYPNYTSMGLPSFLCATVSDSCGATVPLYQFYSSTYDDYYADVEQMNNTNATYSVAMMGLPLCYLWVPLTTTTTTTTSTTTSPLTNTTTNAPLNGTNTTTTTVSSNVTTTTTAPLNGTNTTTTTVSSNVTTTTAPLNGTITTTTVASNGNLTTTTISSGGGGGGNSTSPGDSSENKDDKDGWWHSWRWPIIVAACITGAALVLGLITCLTCCFIGSATVAAKPYTPPPHYSSPSPPELPPQPIDAPAVQPFTVGLPPTVPY